MVPQGSETNNAAAAAVPTVVFTNYERARLDALRARYQGNQDMFTGREMARLRFLRWLVQNGRIES
jgi:hypothetical protein